ncbi:MAG: hypothetical protein VKK59_07280 [Vampirovibrionales bacterium]|nr:hypothetical protein [Vampirovibrionales bacterium]
MGFAIGARAPKIVYSTIKRAFQNGGRVNQSTINTMTEIVQGRYKTGITSAAFGGMAWVSSGLLAVAALGHLPIIAPVAGVLATIGAKASSVPVIAAIGTKLGILGTATTSSASLPIIGGLLAKLGIGTTAAATSTAATGLANVGAGVAATTTGATGTISNLLGFGLKQNAKDTAHMVRTVAAQSGLRNPFTIAALGAAAGGTGALALTSGDKADS